MYNVQLPTEAQVLAHLLYSSTHHFLMKCLKPKHSRTFYTKHFFPKHRIKHFAGDKLSVQVSIFLKDKNELLSCTMSTLTS